MGIKSVVIIGIGTLGGFTAEAIANLEEIEKIVIIDHDIVEQKNLKNSIYRQIDLGSPKVEALKDILSSFHPELEIWAFQAEYIEGVTKLPKEDLVIDCRDATYNRKTEIDARFYMSSRYLMGDFRKNITYKEKQDGKYILELSKSDLRHAASLISMMIHSNSIESLMKNQSVQKYELDYVKHIDTCQCDVVYDDEAGEDKFINLPDTIVPIIDANKTKDITVCLGNRTFSDSKQLIPMNTLQSSKDVVSLFTSLVACQNDFNNFLVSLIEDNNRIFIELIAETGAA